MSIYKNKVNWECMANHCPEWLEKNAIALTACMSKDDINRCDDILDRYNELTKKEESGEEDGFSLYGIEDEKWDLTNEFIALHIKYKAQAMQLEYWKQ